MPRIPNNRPAAKGKQNQGKDISPNGNLQLISHSTCKVCQSPNRHYIDVLLARGYSVRAIESQLKEIGEEINYRSIHRHGQNHLNIEMAHFAKMAQQRVSDIEKEVANGSFRIISNVAALDIIIQKGWDALLYEKVNIEPRDMVQAIKLREEIEKNGLHTIEEEMGKQLNAIIIAIQEIVPEEMWPLIVNRARDIAKGDLLKQMELPVLEGKELVEEIIRAENQLQDDNSIGHYEDLEGGEDDSQYLRPRIETDSSFDDEDESKIFQDGNE